MAAVNDLFPNLPKRLSGLGDLAENLWWSWHPEARMLFKLLDRQAWKESGHNPDKMLRELPADTLAEAARNPAYVERYDRLLDRFGRDMAETPCEGLPEGRRLGEKIIAYFSAEYGLHHSLPFYAGGLGFLSGDFIKECSDLHVPLVAVGFMYPEGYVRQVINAEGWQEEAHQAFDRDAASISRVLGADGTQLVVRVPRFDPPIYVSVWKVPVGKVDLYLMDTDISQNDPWNRTISSRLYIGDLEQRLRQEVVLGIGGSEVLETLGIRHSILHMNEGHAAFALLERIRDRVQAGSPFEEAVDAVKKTSVFTTHTPVPAGHDVFPFHLVERYFNGYWPSMGLSRDRFMALGVTPNEPQAGFNMTALAMRLSGHVNGVSRKHGEVSRRMWQGLWPGLPVDEVPVDYVTNGIHVPTWIEPKMELLFNRYLGEDWLARHDDPALWEAVAGIPDEEMWRIHVWLKIKLINTLRDQARRRWSEEHAGASTVLTGGAMLDPSVLTLGFARRFATYKRADLLFGDTERLKRFLRHRWRPVQIIFAGKAHPADDPGKRVLQRVLDAARNPEMGGRIAFVEDYGEQLAQYLVHGVDVWLNHPLPPMEASGTSGMKAALNGVPQLSILDGWWIEGFNGENGWAFEGHEGEGDRNRADAEAVYDILENQVVPAYYDMGGDGVPHAWIRIMKAAVRGGASRFSARRMVKEYIGKFYSEALKAV